MEAQYGSLAHRERRNAAYAVRLGQSADGKPHALGSSEKITISHSSIYQVSGTAPNSIVKQLITKLESQKRVSVLEQEQAQDCILWATGIMFGGKSVMYAVRLP